MSVDPWPMIKDICTCLWGCAADKIAVINDLEDNLTNLQEKKVELQRLYDDVKGEIGRAGGRELKDKNQVEGWLESVQEKEKIVNKILQQGELEIQQKCIRGRFPKNFCATYDLGGTVPKEITNIEAIIQNREKFGLDFVEPQNASDDLFTVKPIVGPDSTFKEVREYIESTSFGVIGIYGMGGVGKTTLLKRISNELNINHANRSFDPLIWVKLPRNASLSKNESLGKVQEAIRSKLIIDDSLWKNKDHNARANLIRPRLKKKKFVLLIDNLGPQLDLVKAGVPILDDSLESKVVFTTRSTDLFGNVKDLCGKTRSMHQIKMECLSSKAALELLQMNLDEAVMNAGRDISELVEHVAEECKGLPLALITIGRVMANKEKKADWLHAEKQLRSYPSKFPKMTDGVFPKLRFSYDRLSEEIHKECFLYCSLFPEEHEIHKSELINLWIGEGYVNNFANIFEARNHGKAIIGSLERACLLESCDSDDYVRMHDVIRDMALWLNCDQGKKEKVLVQQDAELVQAEGLAKWENAERISLWGHTFEDLIPARFPECRTLIVRKTKLKELAGEFFQKSSRVVDLSYNQELKTLPAEVGKLVNLQYLDLSFTSIGVLPLEVRELKKLRTFLVDGTEMLVPKVVVSQLSSLQIFSKKVRHPLNEKTLLEGLDSLKLLICLGVTLTTHEAIKYLFDSTKLRRCINHLYLARCSDLAVLELTYSSVAKMRSLEILDIRECALQEVKIVPDTTDLRSCFSNLSRVVIHKCPIQNLTWLIYAQNLENLELDECKSISEIIGGDAGEFGVAGFPQDVFSHLRRLDLRYLSNLQRICRPALLFPALEKIKIYDCPKLASLPFNSDSGKNTLKEISGEDTWWNGLQWQPQALEKIFISKFAKLRY